MVQSGRNGRDGRDGIDGRNGNGNNWLKESLDRLWVKHDEMIKIQMAIVTTLKMILPLPSRPCDELSVHLDDHKNIQKSITDKLLGVVFDLGKMAFVALITWYFFRK